MKEARTMNIRVETNLDEIKSTVVELNEQLKETRKLLDFDSDLLKIILMNYLLKITDTDRNRTASEIQSVPEIAKVIAELDY